MFTQSTHLLSTLFLLLSVATVSAQGAIDGFFQPKGSGSATVSFTRSSFEGFYLGETRMDAVPAHNKITQNIYSLYATYGVSDNLTLIANVPYFSAKGDGMPDPVNGETEVSGIQDISLYAKYRPFSATVGEGGRFDGILSAGASVATGYEPNGILSIGHGATAIDLKAGGHLQLGSGLFVTGLAGYSLRGDADNNGDGEDFEVPNAINLVAKVGYGGPGFFVEGFIMNQNSTDGVDIGGEGFMGNFPETEVDFTMIGASFYLPASDWLGISLNYGTLLSGRNVGDANYVGAGLTFSFGK